MFDLQVVHEPCDQVAGFTARSSTVETSSDIALIERYIELASISPTDPFPIERNWMNSPVPLRSKPSAMFEIEDIAALRI
jgi:hypothetical protein